jgi:hypothetical protein
VLSAKAAPDSNSTIAITTPKPRSFSICIFLF